MKYEAELKFFMAFLKNSRIPCRIISSYAECANELDVGLRRLINPNADAEKALRTLFGLCGSNKIYRILDEFLFYYLILQLPDTDTDAPVFVVIGPYSLAKITKRDIQSRIQKYSLPLHIMPEIEKVFYSIPAIPSESQLMALVYTLGESIWGGLDSFSLQDVKNSVFFDLEPVAERPENKEPMDAFLSMRILEERYAIENQLIKAVSQGQSHKAEMYMSQLACTLEPRTSDPVRNLKNYLIIANTLLRKSAEAGSVHPLHIDSLSTRLAIQIEQTYTEEALHRLANDIARKYCLLVKNHSMKGYSLLVRKILVRIDSDLTADLSLKAQADFLDVNPSYLSTLFKKETGTTLTEYVNRKRVEHGIFLLNTTQMQIQMIAQNCGISDVNYFTKTFKKIVGKTPKEYRNNISPYVRKKDAAGAASVG